MKIFSSSCIDWTVQYSGVWRRGLADCAVADRDPWLGDISILLAYAASAPLTPRYRCGQNTSRYSYNKGLIIGFVRLLL